MRKVDSTPHPSSIPDLSKLVCHTQVQNPCKGESVHYSHWSIKLTADLDLKQVVVTLNCTVLNCRSPRVTTHCAQNISQRMTKGGLTIAFRKLSHTMATHGMASAISCHRHTECQWHWPATLALVTHGSEGYWRRPQVSALDLSSVTLA